MKTSVAFRHLHMLFGVAYHQLTKGVTFVILAPLNNSLLTLNIVIFLVVISYISKPMLYIKLKTPWSNWFHKRMCVRALM